MKIPHPLEDLGEIFKSAIRLEFGSPAGKVNAWGLFLAVVLVAIGTATGWLEDAIRVFKPKAVSPPTDFTELFLIFAALVLSCVLLIVLDGRKRSGK